MNPGHEKFFNFIIERVQNGKQDQARALLNESFSKQDNETFTSEYLTGFGPKLTALLKPESVNEVKAIISKFGQGFTRP